MFSFLFLAHVLHHLAVLHIETLTGDVALETDLTIEHREPLGMGHIKDAHHVGHGHTFAESSLRVLHELGSAEMVIELDTEHHVANLRDVNLA